MQSRVALFGPQINDGTYMSVRHVLPDLDLICNVYCLVKFMLSFPNTSVTLYIYCHATFVCRILSTH